VDNNFDKIVWNDKGLEIAHLQFVLEKYKKQKDAESFILFKDKIILSEYEKYFATYTRQVNNILEIGMWDGGSMALWYELLKPAKIVGVDIENKQDSENFIKWKNDRITKDASLIKTFWNIDQTNKTALLDICKNELEDNIDMIIDDASHVYDFTLVSFETLFPLLKPGGIYIIEDWAWLHWKELVHYFPRGQGLSKLVCEIIQSLGSTEALINSVTVYHGFAVIEKGEKEISENFRLQDHIYLPNYKKRKFRQRIKAGIRAFLNEQRK